MAKRSKALHEKLKQSVLDDPEAYAEYQAYKLQLELAEKMKHAREKANLTQDDMAEQLCTTKSAIARLEAAGGKNKHSPSLKTLAKYAHILGYQLHIGLKRSKQ